MAWQRAEQLRSEARQLRVKFNNIELPAPTLSLGVAAFPKHGATPRELLACADSHLYLAKNAGRDRVIAGEQIQQSLSSWLVAHRTSGLTATNLKRVYLGRTARALALKQYN